MRKGILYVLWAAQGVLASVDQAKSRQKPRLAVPAHLWLWKKKVLRVAVTLVASEQVAHLLMGEFCCFIILEGGRALVATHKKRQPEMRYLGHCRAGKQVYHLRSVCCGARGLKGSFVHHQVSCKRKVPLQLLPPRPAQSTHSGAPSWPCPLMLPLTYWVPHTEIISLPVPPPHCWPHYCTMPLRGHG